VLVFCTVPATGSVTLGVTTMLANIGKRLARSTNAHLVCRGLG
jgi:hypothetical protein